MPKNRIYLCLAHMSPDGAEQRYVKEAFETNWVVPLGPNVDAFEEDLKQYVAPDKEVVALASGTSAVHLALIACGVQPADEVIVQSFTFCASANPVAYLGANPVFVDSERDTWNMNPDLLSNVIEDRISRTGRKPKAIIPVTLYGMPYHIDRILEIADRYDVPVIEDTAEGFGSTFNGRCLGSFGSYGVFSFNGNKMITTSGGGALVVPDGETKKRILWLATQARESFPYYQHEALGYNYRLSNVCAGIGRGQMSVLADHLAHHRHVADLYRQAFADVEGISFHDSSLPGSNFWLSTIILDPALKIKGQELAYGGITGATCGQGPLHSLSEPNANVEALRQYLDLAMVESRPLWKPMHLQPVFANGGVATRFADGVSLVEGPRMSAYVDGTSENIFRQGLCLPSGPCVSDSDVAYIVDSIKQAII